MTESNSEPATALDESAALVLLPQAAARDAAATAPEEAAETMALVAAIERLEQVLDHETNALSRLSVPELKDLNRRKSLCLLELTRAARGFGEDAARASLRPRLEHLRATIARNQAILETHLDAVREIAGTIAASLEARESDGTYSAAPGLGSV